MSSNGSALKSAVSSADPPYPAWNGITDLEIWYHQTSASPTLWSFRAPPECGTWASSNRPSPAKPKKSLLGGLVHQSGSRKVFMQHLAALDIHERSPGLQHLLEQNARGPRTYIERWGHSHKSSTHPFSSHTFIRIPSGAFHSLILSLFGQVPLYPSSPNGPFFFSHLEHLP